MYYSRILAAGSVLSALMLAGCAALGGGEASPTENCGAAALQDKIGQPVTGETAINLRVGGEPVQSSGTVRVLAPGDAATMDFSPERLTIETDSVGNLISAKCQ